MYARQAHALASQQRVRCPACMQRLLNGCTREQPTFIHCYIIRLPPMQFAIETVCKMFSPHTKCMLGATYIHNVGCSLNTCKMYRCGHCGGSNLINECGFITELGPGIYLTGYLFFIWNERCPLHCGACTGTRSTMPCQVENH